MLSPKDLNTLRSRFIEEIPEKFGYVSAGDLSELGDEYIRSTLFLAVRKFKGTTYLAIVGLYSSLELASIACSIHYTGNPHGMLFVKEDGYYEYDSGYQSAYQIHEIGVDENISLNYLLDEEVMNKINRGRQNK